MACDNGNCPTAFERLCSFVGQICINIETVIGGLIRNQQNLIDTLFPDLGTEFANCAQVYLEPATCTYTEVLTDTAIVIGTQIGDRVYTGGRTSCVTFPPVAGVYPSCGENVNGWLLLEDATAQGCALAIRSEFTFFDQFLDMNTVIPDGAFQLSVGSVTIPRQGRYEISQGQTIVGTAVIRSGFIINGVTFEAIYQDQVMNTRSDRENVWLCLDESDVLQQFIEPTGAAVTADVWGLQVAYYGEC